ncbi:hypothetical protein BDV25DRAFT_128842 [Aspergillus avenaceus]|uniref:Uncharacterized protein n=1 Tax=Aspergillus avenaceus TaxID=36643 RepID=A0A5N6TYB9_ASPAV|nr:hypothetical protein BDV25DRAFT_128842 [Aspergillus avenaceus]
MGTEDSGLHVSATDQSQRSLPSAVDTHQFSDSDESSSDDDVTWSPGDGVCPTTAQFNHCCQSKIDDWRNAANTHRGETTSLEYHLTSFLGLLKDVPLFYHCPPAAVNISGRRKSYLILKSSLQIKTTEDPNCDQPQKPIDYLQCLGSPAPVKYRTKAETQLEAAIPVSGKAVRSGYFTTGGEKSRILHEQEMRIEDSFWDIVTQGRWVAWVKKGKGVFYSPWMLKEEGTTQQFQRGDWKSVTSNSSLAFDILLDFCMSESLEGEFLTGFASVLILTSRHAPPPKFAPPVMISTAPMPCSPSKKDGVFLELFQSIDKFICLSATQDAMDSLICSAFFDPCVPCNFLGAASLGVKKALSTVEKVDNGLLLSAVTNMKPHLSLLWAAVVCNDQVTAFLNMAFRGLPPICLIAAFWTNTPQSFLQITYPIRGSQESAISRTSEFQTSYFCRPTLSVPWSPAPPFGATPVENLSLEVRVHLAHIHRPISWRIYWILDSNERIPAGAEHQFGLVEARSMWYSGSSGCAIDFSDPERYTADEQSGSATSRLFNWHRSYDDGIWLDDGQGDIELIRRLQMHPWIIDPFESDEDEPVEESKPREICIERILQWKGEVESTDGQDLLENGEPL